MQRQGTAKSNHLWTVHCFVTALHTYKHCCACSTLSYQYCAASATTEALSMLQTEELQKCMVSNKEYYAPVLEEGDSFAESKEKFDAASSSQSPQELKGESDSNEGEKVAPSEPPAGKTVDKPVVCYDAEQGYKMFSCRECIWPHLVCLVVCLAHPSNVIYTFIAIPAHAMSLAYIQ